MRANRCENLCGVTSGLCDCKFGLERLVGLLVVRMSKRQREADWVQVATEAIDAATTTDDIYRLRQSLSDLRQRTEKRAIDTAKVIALERISTAERSGEEALSFDDLVDLVELPDAIGNLKGLKRLSVAGCAKLQQLPGSIGKLVNLEELYLYERGMFCGITKLPTEFTRLASLHRLNMGGPDLHMEGEDAEKAADMIAFLKTHLALKVFSPPIQWAELDNVCSKLTAAGIELVWD